jgi:hypothetical protein
VTLAHNHVVPLIAAEVSHHRTQTYRMAMMHVLKAEIERDFAANKAGVIELASCVDLNAVLMGVNLDVDSLKDPSKLPLTREAAVQQKTSPRRKGGASRLGSVMDCSDAFTFCGCGGKQKRPFTDRHDDDDGAADV